MTVTETAAAKRIPAGRSSLFPPSWGPPPLDPVERCAWVAFNVRGRPMIPSVEYRVTAPPARGRGLDGRLALLQLRQRER